MKSTYMEYTSIISIGLVDLGFAILGVIAINHGFGKVGVLLLTVAILGTVSKIWTKTAGKKMEASIKADKKNLFPGDSCELRFAVSNRGSIPVLWAESVKPFRDNSSVVPEENPHVSVLPMTSDEKAVYRIPENEKASLMRIGFGAAFPGRSNYLKLKWKAVKRGLTKISDMDFYTGDGFRLSRIPISLDESGTRELVVYPKIVPVDVKYFTKVMWEGQSSTRGYLEDTSIIKLTRPYRHGDPEKQINWRMLARGQEMTVNQYSTISLKSVHFIFDGASFGKGEMLEDTLSILASLALKLSDSGIDAGFSFPRSAGLKASNIPAVRESIGEILYRMAEFMPVPEKTVNTAAAASADSSEKAGKIQERREFLYETLPETAAMAGRVYLVSRNSVTAEACAVNGIRYEVFTYDRLKEFKGGEGNAADRTA